jgi:uncharacterized protein
MRAVVDTNVIVSALLSPNGPPGQVLNAILAGKLIVLYDDRILWEYRDVLTRTKFRFSSTEIDALLEFVAQFGEYFSGQHLDVILPDQSDLPFLEVAVAGFVDALITGNTRHFKPIKGRHTVKVITPAEFVGQPN